MKVDSSQSLVPNETLPEKSPPVAELKLTVNVVEPPAGTVVVPKVEPNVKPVPVTVIGPVSVKSVVPELEIVKVPVNVVPAETEPISAKPPSKTFTEDKVTSISPGVVALNLKLSI